MRNTMFTLAAMLALGSSGCLTQGALADEPPPVRHAKKACQGPHCGPYKPCGARCRVVCTDRYSCAPLYGAYGPYGGVGYWGGFTYAGWGRWQ
jgi:hypothetical protein